MRPASDSALLIHHPLEIRRFAAPDTRCYSCEVNGFVYREWALAHFFVSRKPRSSFGNRSPRHDTEPQERLPDGDHAARRREEPAQRGGLRSGRGGAGLRLQEGRPRRRQPRRQDRWRQRRHARLRRRRPSSKSKRTSRTKRSRSTSTQRQGDLSRTPTSATSSTSRSRPQNAGRIAAQTAKQVVLQRLREAEREVVFEEYSGKEGDIISRRRPPPRGAPRLHRPRQDRGRAAAVRSRCAPSTTAPASA